MSITSNVSVVNDEDTNMYTRYFLLDVYNEQCFTIIGAGEKGVKYDVICLISFASEGSAKQFMADVQKLRHTRISHEGSLIAYRPNSCILCSDKIGVRIVSVYI